MINGSGQAGNVGCSVRGHFLLVVDHNEGFNKFLTCSNDCLVCIETVSMLWLSLSIAEVHIQPLIPPRKRFTS